MQILQAIEQADALCPNPYTFEEKLRWCHEVSAGIRRDIKKIYTTIETTLTAGQEIPFPEEFAFEDLELVLWNGTPMDKLDFRSLQVDKSLRGKSGTLKLIFLEQPAPVRQFELQGEFDVGENFIPMENPPLEEGDLLEWVPLEASDSEPDWSNPNRCYVLGMLYNGIQVDDDTFVAQTGMPLAIRRVLTDVTEVDEAPYDGMYVEYLLAKMALYQHDYTAYGAHMAQYNNLYESLRRDYKTRSPLTDKVNFRHYW